MKELGEENLIEFVFKIQMTVGLILNGQIIQLIFAWMFVQFLMVLLVTLMIECVFTFVQIKLSLMTTQGLVLIAALSLMVFMIHLEIIKPIYVKKIVNNQIHMQIHKL